MEVNFAGHALAVREMIVSGPGLIGLTVKEDVTGVVAVVGVGTPSNI